MKYLALALLLTGCTQSPDFTHPVEVVEKETSDGITTYTLREEHSWRGPVVFNAPAEFAQVGSIIEFHRGAIRVRKEGWKLK